MGQVENDYGLGALVFGVSTTTNSLIQNFGTIKAKYGVGHANNQTNTESLRLENFETIIGTINSFSGAVSNDMVIIQA